MKNRKTPAKRIVMQPIFRLRVVKAKKGKGSYRRNAKYQ